MSLRRDAMRRYAQPVETLAERHASEAARSVGHWLGVGLALGPSFDIASRHGLLTSLASPSTLELPYIAEPLGLIALFVVLGVAAARMLPAHSPRGRTLFFVACAIPVAIWVLYTGLRAATMVPIVALVFAFVRLRALPR